MTTVRQGAGVNVGDKVQHFINANRIGVVVELETGCNALVGVDFGNPWVSWMVPNDLYLFTRGSKWLH